MTREEIKEFSGVEPNCFETDREEDWYKIGCIDGLDAADADPDTSSLWHDASEEPKGTYIVLCDGLDNSQWVVDYRHIDMAYANWQDYADAISVSRWAYISDLLPKQFGNSELLKGGKQ